MRYKQLLIRSCLLGWLMYGLLGCGSSQSGQQSTERARPAQTQWEMLSLSGVGVDLEVPTSWEWSEAREAWVVHPSPPEDDLFLLLLRGESEEALKARLNQLFPLQIKPAAAPVKLQWATPPLDEGSADLEEEGEVYFVTRSYTIADEIVLITAFLTLRGRAPQALAPRGALIERVLNSAKVKY